MIWSSWDFQPERGTLKEEISIDSRPERVFVGVSYRDYMFLCCSMVTTTPNANPTVTMKLMYALYALYALESWVGNVFPRYNIIVIQYDRINPKAIFPSNTMCSRIFLLRKKGELLGVPHFFRSEVVAVNERSQRMLESTGVAFQTLHYES